MISALQGIAKQNNKISLVLSENRLKRGTQQAHWNRHMTSWVARAQTVVLDGMPEAKNCSIEDKHGLTAQNNESHA